MRAKAGVRERVWTVYGAMTPFGGIIKLRKYANGKKHDGPVGWKARPSRMLAVAMAARVRAMRARVRS